jgi:hypothetical protein
MPMTVQRRRRHDRSFAFYPSAAVVGKAQRLRPNIRSRSPRSTSSSCKSGHQWISLTNAQFESALQKARKQPGAAHVEILLGSKMVTPPLLESHPTSVCSFLSGIGGAIRRKRKKRSCVPPLVRRLRPSRRPADARISATEAGAHFRVRCRRALCRACVVQSPPVRGGVVWAPRPDRIGYC